MRSLIKSAAAATVVFIVYFVAGSLISDSLRFPYGYVSIGALLLFGWAGYHFCRSAGLLASAIATGMAALVSALASWILLGLIGPSFPPPRADAVAEVLVMMTLAAIGIGALGAAVSHVSHRSSHAA